MPVNAPIGGSRLPVLKIDAVSVTRDLPPSLSAPEPSSNREYRPAPLSRPTVDVPKSPQLDYPVYTLPTQGEFAEAAEPSSNKSNDKKASDKDTANARELSSKLPPTGAIQQLFRPPTPLLQEGFRPLAATNNALPAPAPVAKPEAPAASVTLPLVGTIPLPSRESVALASTTAVTATFVAVLGKAAFESSLEGIKPLLRIAAIRYKKMRNRDLSDQELQMEFSFEMKQKGKRTFAQSMGDLRDYFRDNFFDDLIGS